MLMFCVLHFIGLFCFLHASSVIRCVCLRRDAFADEVQALDTFNLRSRLHLHLHC